MSSSPTIHIIGAGLAGLAAAVRISGAGGKVVVYESAPQAGGRCRSFYDKKLKMDIDNGNHLVLGANPGVLSYLHELGTLKDCITSDRPNFLFSDLETRKHFHMRPPTRYPGIGMLEWLHVFKLWKPRESKTVAACFPKNSGIFKRLVEPMTLAILNTAPERASARLLRDVLQRILMAGTNGWRSYAFSSGLSAALVDPALTKIKGRGGSVHLGRVVNSLQVDGDRITGFSTSQGEVALGENDKLILAVQPSALKSLLPELAVELDYEPILNAHFAWAQSGQFRDVIPFMGVLNGTVQWLFFHPGRLSTTTSAAGEWMDMDEEKLAKILWGNVCDALFLGDVKMPPCRIIKEKRATYAATPDMLSRLPSPQTRFANLRLAGDYVNSTLPSTLEAAVLSGFDAARWATGAQPSPADND